MSDTKRLYIVDAMAMAFRCYHAFGVRPLTTSDGLPVSAVFGSAMFLLKLIEDEKPDYLVVASDSREPTFRHQLYSQYKANRTEMPEDLAIQLPYLFELFECLNIPLLRIPGMEADDLIGSIVTQFKEPNLRSYIVSGDKDFMQLINAQVQIYTPKKGGEFAILDEKSVFEKFGCTPEQVIDVLALIGDSSDNVPGVPGIGEKGAAKLIQEFGSIAGIYQGIDNIKNQRLRESLKTNRELADLSRTLVTIDCNVKLPLTLADFVCKPDEAMARPQLLAFVSKLQFTSLEKRLKKFAENTNQVSAPINSNQSISPETVLAKSLGPVGECILSADRLEMLSAKLKDAKYFAFDTETTGLDIISDVPIGISLAFQDHSNFYIPLAGYHGQTISEEAIKKFLVDDVGRSPGRKIAHNLKFDLQMLTNIGVSLSGDMGDTMICSYLIDPVSKSHGLDRCTLDELDFKKIPTSALIGADGAKSMKEVPADQISEYACEDALATIRLYEKYCPKIRELGLEKVLNEIEIPLIPVLARMEQSGVFIDPDILHEISIDLDSRGKELEKTIFEIAGKSFNINSPKQLQSILFDDLKIHEQLGIKRIKKTKSGFSTDSSVLELLSAHPLPNAILSYRTVSKLKNTYVDALPQLIHPKTNRIHTSFHQTGTATGRLSSSNPNLQNIPIRSDLGKQIRKAFRSSRSENSILSADYSQVELRILADLANEETLIKAFEEGEDIHRATAAKIFGVESELVDATLRSRAKAINFGIIYGMGPQRLARETGVSLPDAKEFIERYFAGFPGIGKYIDESVEYAREYGFSRTITGRRRPIPELRSENQGERVMAENIAVNSPVQGSAADLIKKAMIGIDRQFSSLGLKARMLLQVHDELVFECPDEELSQVKTIVKDQMENALKLKARLQVEMGDGKNWLEAH